MSRIARNNRGLAQSFWRCVPSSETILADEDGVYDPKDTNDRLLLGLKGTISEFEARYDDEKADWNEVIVAAPQGSTRRALFTTCPRAT